MGPDEFPGFSRQHPLATQARLACIPAVSSCFFPLTLASTVSAWQKFYTKFSKTRGRAGDRAAGEQLIVENSGLIWSIARRYFGRGVDPDDLYQLGCLGFLKAVEGYDTAHGTQSSTSAPPKLAGEIRRFLRDDGSLKPRT